MRRKFVSMLVGVTVGVTEHVTSHGHIKNVDRKGKNEKGEKESKPSSARIKLAIYTAMSTIHQTIDKIMTANTQDRLSKTRVGTSQRRWDRAMRASQGPDVGV